MSVGSLVLGLLNGLTYGLLGVGVVLVYNSNRFINLAHAQLGVLSAQLLSLLAIRWGWSWWAGVAVCIPVGIAVAVGVESLIIRRLRNRRASGVALLLASIGISQILIGLSSLPILRPGTTALVQRGYPLPFRSTVQVGDVVLNGANLLVAAVVPIVVIVLATFLRRTTLGKTIRAAASNPDAARLCGVSVSRASVISWGIAGGLAALTAILQAPSAGTFSADSFGPQLLLLGLGAAAAGAFTSIEWAMAGGIAIGILQQGALAVTSNASTANVWVLAFTLLVVLVRGKSISSSFATRGAIVADIPPLRVPLASRFGGLVGHRRLIGTALLLAVAICVPWIPSLATPRHWFELSLIAVYALLAQSLTVLVGWGGQVSLGHFALLGTGAIIGARLMNNGWPLIGAMAVASVVGAALLCIVGIPSLRSPGLTLPITTLGLALVAPEWLFRQTWFGTNKASGIILRHTELLPGWISLRNGRTVYLVAIATIALTATALHAIRRSALGRAMIAVRDNERAAGSFGIRPASSKLFVLAVSGAIAAAAGTVWAVAWRSVTPQQFNPSISLALVALPIIGGIGSVTGAVFGGVLFYAATLYISPHVQGLFGALGGDLGFVTFLGGLSIVGLLMQLPQGLAGKTVPRWQRLLDRWALADRAPIEASARPTRADSHGKLEVDDLRISFGGINALDDVSLDVGNAEIVGIIGPNGSGKSTLLNVISGHLTPRAGRVRLGGTDVTGKTPASRSARGLGRNFQDAGLFPGLTVVETLETAMTPRGRAGLAWLTSRSSWSPRRERRRRDEARALSSEMGLQPWAGNLTGELSTGTRRICDFAAQLAARPSVLLLDEPTAGVAQRDAEAFGPLVRSIRDELGCSILIVEHDMPLLMGVCDRVYAMEAGRVIASGTPDQIRHDPAVIASYLGTDESAISRSG